MQKLGEKRHDLPGPLATPALSVLHCLQILACSECQRWLTSSWTKLLLFHLWYRKRDSFLLSLFRSPLSLLVFCTFFSSVLQILFAENGAKIERQYLLLSCLMRTSWSRGHAKTPIPGKPSKSGLIGVWHKDNLYLGTSTIENGDPHPTNIDSRTRSIRMTPRSQLFFDKSFSVL